MLMIADKKIQSIFLVGFMGAGKSTVGRHMAELTGALFVDLDSLIEQRTAMSIPEIFSRFGEVEFRQQETSALVALPAAEALIIATGGGVVGREENWRLMRSKGVVVYLRAGWKTLEERIGSGEGRPLASGAERTRLRALWEQRLPLYELADVVVDADLASPEAVARRILAAIEGRKGRN